MFIRKSLAYLLAILFFSLGILVSVISHDYPGMIKTLLSPPSFSETTSSNPSPEPKEEVPPPPKPSPAQFFMQFNLNELNQFDQLYEQRSTQLRDIIAGGNQQPAADLLPEGIFAQMELIKTKIKFIQTLPAYTKNQDALKQAFATAYGFLSETFEQEINFLKGYPSQGQDISYLTDNLFAISSKDQRGGLQYMDCLMSYRKLLAEAIRKDETPEKNQSWLQDLVSVNTLIEKYRTRLNVPKDTI